MGIMPVITILLICQDIRTNKGFIYSVPNGSSARNCEQGWYTPNGTFLSDGDTPKNGNRHPLVVEENMENITLSECIQLEHRRSCHLSGKDGEKVVHRYKVSADNTSSAAGNTSSAAGNTSAAVPIAVLIGVLIAALGIGIFCYIKRKKQEGCAC